MTAGPTPVIEVGGTHVTAALVNIVSSTATIADGTESRAPLNSDGTAAEIIDQIVRTARTLAAPPGAHWGVAIPGPFDYVRGIARYHGVGKFDALNGTDFGQLLRDDLNADAVSFLNDADAFLLGEWRFGAARGHDRCAGITLGTGIGSAFLADGIPQATGQNVPPGGRADLLWIHGKPLEDTVSRRAIRAAYRARTHQENDGGADPDVDQIAALARDGEPVATSVLNDAFTQLGATLGPWLTRFGATIVVAGGAMTRSWDIIGPPLLAKISVPVVLAAYPRDAALLGAAAYAEWNRHRVPLV